MAGNISTYTLCMTFDPSSSCICAENFVEISEYGNTQKLKLQALCCEMVVQSGRFLFKGQRLFTGLLLHLTLFAIWISFLQNPQTQHNSGKIKYSLQQSSVSIFWWIIDSLSHYMMHKLHRGVSGWILGSLLNCFMEIWDAAGQS